MIPARIDFNKDGRRTMKLTTQEKCEKGRVKNTTKWIYSLGRDLSHAQVPEVDNAFLCEQGGQVTMHATKQIPTLLGVSRESGNMIPIPPLANPYITPI